MSNKLVLIAYHDKCMDGYTAAYVTEFAMRNRMEQVECILLPMSYTAESYEELVRHVAMHPVTEVYVVDFSVPYDILHRMHSAGETPRITVLDHHKTAFENYFPETTYGPGAAETKKIGPENNPWLIIRCVENMSGAALCWDYFFSELWELGPVPPFLVRYVDDRDRWVFAYGDETKCIHNVLKSADYSYKQWNLFHRNLEDAASREVYLREGRIIQAKHDRRVAEISEAAELVNWEGHAIYVVDCHPEFASDVGHVLANKSGTFSLTFFTQADRGKIKFSLRSVKDFDVSVLAKRHGGGGHKNAAGFYKELSNDGCKLGIKPVDDLTENKGS